MNYLTEEGRNFGSMSELSDILNLEDQVNKEVRLSGADTKNRKAHGRFPKYQESDSDNILPISKEYNTFLEGPNNMPKIPTYYLSKK